MDTTNKSKWQVRIAALLIFVLGFAAGALALSAYKRFGRAASREAGFAQTLEDLKLTAEQKTQVDQILGDTRQQLRALRKESEPRVAEIRHQADERLQKVLTSEQWTQFQQAREKMHNRDRRGRGGREE
jgi:hypothetical protein